MKNVNILFLLILALVWCCSSRSNNISYDKETDFDKYQYYNWAERENNPADRASNPVPHRAQLESFLQQAITQDLGRKGFTKTVANPDFLVSYRITLRDKIHVEDWSQLNDYDNNDDNIMQLPYKEGTILVDIFDVKADKVSWRGYSSDVVKSDFSMNRVERNIRETVSKLMADFPPR